MDRTTVIAYEKQLNGVKAERFSDLAIFHEIPNNVGERCRKQKFSYGFTKIHLGVHLATSDRIASTYLCRSRAEAFKERG